MSPHVAALLFGLALAAVFAAGILLTCWLVSREIDAATRLPARPKAVEPPTERITTTPIHDLPRRGSLIDRKL